VIGGSEVEKAGESHKSLICHERLVDFPAPFLPPVLPPATCLESPGRPDLVSFGFSFEKISLKFTSQQPRSLPPKKKVAAPVLLLPSLLSAEWA